MTVAPAHRAADRSPRFDGRRGRAVLRIITITFLSFLSVASPAAAATAHADGATNPVCVQCHTPHVAPTERSLLSDVTESQVCYVCHGDPVASDWNVETGTANSFAPGMTSGHALEDVTDPEATMDLTNSCTGCHGVHGDPAVSANLPANETLAGATVDPADPRSWCLACHNSEHAWYAGYPVNTTLRDAYEVLVCAPVRDASKYPTLGTFSGGDHYASSTHASIPSGSVESLVSEAVPAETVTRVAGDCMWCHASHRSTATHDGLLGEYRASTADDATGGTTEAEYAQACFECHGNSSGTVYLPAATYTDTYWASTAGAPDIYSLVTDAANSRSGHRIQTSGAYYAVGSPVPCYECHNPHGSKKGNALMISDALGGSLDPTGSALENRYFCFTCHATSPDGGTTWYGSDGTAMVAVHTGATAVGLSRIDAANKLTLSSSSMHGRDVTTGCSGDYGCHGSAHDPNGGVSTGGTRCYLCHGVYEENMESGETTASLSYHHVLGGTQTGDYAFTSTTYPSTVSAANTDVYCLSCHVDHDKFYNGDTIDKKGYNLRSSLTSSPTAANSDYNDADGGICLGCHAIALTKSTGQKTSATESATTPAITLGMYMDKAHDYGVTSSFTGTADNTYSANCVKCHNDEQAQQTGGSYTGYQTSTYKFGTHWSAENRIAAALGAYSVLSASMTSTEETLCFKCHDGSTTSNNDGYNVTPNGSAMTASSQNVKNQFTLSYTHGVDDLAMDGIHRSDETAYSSANKHVECEDCHNAHAAGKTMHTPGGVLANGSDGNAIGTDSPLLSVWGVDYVSYPTIWTEPNPTTGYSVVTGSTGREEYQICFKCHSSYNTAYSAGATPVGVNSTFSWDGTDGTDENEWTNVALEFNPNNRSYHPVVSSLGATKALTSTWMDADWQAVGTQTMTCSDCHGAMASTAQAVGPHGSSIPHILKGYWPIYPGADGTLGTGDDAPYTVNGLNGGTQSGILCDRCHEGFANQRAHSQSAGVHAAAACYRCHIVVPHGGKLSRLIGDANSNMPSRYAYAGNVTNTWVSQYTWNSTTLSKVNCSVVSAASPCLAPKGHSTATTGLTNWD